MWYEYTTYYIAHSSQPCGRKTVTVFFFQAEDGIRGTSVTGVQTCALPILAFGVDGSKLECPMSAANEAAFGTCGKDKIGRASCRERVWESVGAISIYIRVEC